MDSAVGRISIVTICGKRHAGCGLGKASRNKNTMVVVFSREYGLIIVFFDRRSFSYEESCRNDSSVLLGGDGYRYV